MYSFCIKKDLGANVDLKAITLVLLAIFIVLAVALFLLSGAARAYGEFCRGEGYELAGKVGNRPSCLIVNDTNVEYRYFSCEPNCSFEGKQKTQLTTTPTPDLIIDLNEGTEKGGVLMLAMARRCERVLGSTAGSGSANLHPRFHCPQSNNRETRKRF